MKRVINIIISIFLLSSCEKQPFDYRNKFVGDYEFTTTVRETNVSCCENNQACCLKETEVVFQGSISYGEEENEIIIHYITDEYELYNYGVEVKEGKYEVAISVLGDFGINNDNGFNSSGEIEFFLGGMHGFVTHTVMGKKID